MRIAAVAILAAALLAACSQGAPSGQQQETTSAADATGGGAFPNLSQASYRSEATITDSRGRSMPIVMIRDGGKMRMELTTRAGQSTIISNPESGETYILTNAGGRLMAMRTTALNQFENPADKWNAEYTATATRSGSCSVAGQDGGEWTRTDSDGKVNTVCVTHDGILLRAAEGDRTVWEATSVERGPQAADQFALPPGVQVVDLNNIGGAVDALARARDAQEGH